MKLTDLETLWEDFCRDNSNLVQRYKDTFVRVWCSEGKEIRLRHVEEMYWTLDHLLAIGDFALLMLLKEEDGQMDVFESYRNNELLQKLLLYIVAKEGSSWENIFNDGYFSKMIARYSYRDVWLPRQQKTDQESELLEFINASDSEKIIKFKELQEQKKRHKREFFLLRQHHILFEYDDEFLLNGHGRYTEELSLEMMEQLDQEWRHRVQTKHRQRLHSIKYREILHKQRADRESTIRNELSTIEQSWKDYNIDIFSISKLETLIFDKDICYIRQGLSLLIVLPPFRFIFGVVLIQAALIL